MIRMKFLVDEDIANYREISMFIGFPDCTFKCDRENHCELCQNSSLTFQPNIFMEAETIVERYLKDPLSHALVIGGLEPFDTLPQLLELIAAFRKQTLDDIVIYTGYTQEELENGDIIVESDKAYAAAAYQTIIHSKNIVIKFGRFRPNEESHFDHYLGVWLANEEQYARRFNE